MVGDQIAATITGRVRFQMTDGELLAELRGYQFWNGELEDLAEEAAARGLLRSAYDFAQARYFTGGLSSSSSSVTFMVADGPMDVRADPALCDLLREELVAVLRRR